MSVDSIVQEAMADGYAFPCAYCKKLWFARSMGYQGGCEAELKGLACGGPVVGLGFPLYDGPLTDEHLASHCFRCGAGPLRGPAGDKVIEVAPRPGTRGRKLGLCKRHLPLVDRIKPTTEKLTG